MACGNKDFIPSYSDILRLEAIVADLAPKSTAPAENATTAKVSAAQYKPELTPRKQPSSHVASNYAPALPQMGGLSLSGTIGNTGTRSTTKPSRPSKNALGATTPVVTPDLIPGDNGAKEVAVIASKQWNGSSWFDDGKIYVWKADGTEFTSLIRNGKI